MTLTNLKNSSLLIFWLLLEEKIHLLWRKHTFFWKGKKLFCQFFTRIESSNVWFSLFFVIQTLTFQIWFLLTSRTLFLYILVVPRQFFSISSARKYFLKKIIFPFFRPNRDFRLLFFTFIVLQRIAFYIWFLPTQRTSFSHILVVTKKNFSCDPSML